MAVYCVRAYGEHLLCLSTNTEEEEEEKSELIMFAISCCLVVVWGCVKPDVHKAYRSKLYP